MTLRPVHKPFRVQIVTDAQLEYFREAVIGARHFGFETGRIEFVDRWLDHEMRGDLAALVRRDRVQGIVAPIHTVKRRAPVCGARHPRGERLPHPDRLGAAAGHPG
jgi:hypothetical protein